MKLFNANVLLVCAGLGVSSASYAQSVPLEFSIAGPANLQVGQTGIFTVIVNTANQPNEVELQSFGLALNSLGPVATVLGVDLLSPWTAIPTDPYDPAVAGFSATPLGGSLQLFSITVMANEVGTANFTFFQPNGDARFVWNGTYIPTGSSDRVACFVNPTGGGSFNVVNVPAPGAAATFAMIGLWSTRRRR